jgi:hypothetical protein
MPSYRLCLFLLTSATLIQFCMTSARAASLEAFAGAVSGFSSCNTFVTPAPIANSFGNQIFNVGTTGNGISACSLQGGTQDVTQAVGPLTSPPESLSNVSVPGSGGGTFTGSANGTANYGIVGAAANGQFTGSTGPLIFTEAAGFGVFDDMLTITSPNHAAGSMGTA